MNVVDPRCSRSLNSWHDALMFGCSSCRTTLSLEAKDDLSRPRCIDAYSPASGETRPENLHTPIMSSRVVVRRRRRRPSHLRWACPKTAMNYSSVECAGNNPTVLPGGTLGILESAFCTPLKSSCWGPCGGWLLSISLGRNWQLVHDSVLLVFLFTVVHVH